MKCSFDPNGKLCECRAGGLSEEEMQGCSCMRAPLAAFSCARCVAGEPRCETYCGDASRCLSSGPRPHGLVKPGWYCAREEGHEGPCAAWPVSHETWPGELQEHGRMSAAGHIGVTVALTMLGVTIGWILGGLA